jgi:hypothetical protein
MCNLISAQQTRHLYCVHAHLDWCISVLVDLRLTSGPPQAISLPPELYYDMGGLLLEITDERRYLGQLVECSDYCLRLIIRLEDVVDFTTTDINGFHAF